MQSQGISEEEIGVFEKKILVSLIADFLKCNNLAYSHSIFISES